VLTITRHDLPRASAYDQAGDLVGEAAYVLVQTVQMDQGAAYLACGHAKLLDERKSRMPIIGNRRAHPVDFRKDSDWP
jgi:hypothetical protein